MKIFGLGLSRTGTKSLTLALQRLGHNVVHYPRDEATLRDLMRGNYNFSALQTHDGITDITVAPFYPQLDALFPASKFILTTRDKEAWLRSMESFFAKPLHPNKADNETIKQLRLILRFAVYGSYEFNRERFSCVFDEHTQRVQEYFRGRPDSLLVLDITAGDGWEKLCAFLGQPLPNEPFPSVKTTAEVKR
jgi:hypothetical protein